MKCANSSGIVGFLFFVGLLALFYEWPSIIDRTGTEATAHVTQKIEGIRIPFDNWYRSFEIVAAFRLPGNPIEHHAVCDVEQDTYDSLHPGDSVTVRYWPALLSQPFIPATHLSPCTPRANITSNPELYRKLQIVFGSLAGILLLVFVFRLRIALWLLLPWFYLFLVIAVVPQAEPAPSDPRAVQATIRNATTITTIMEGQMSTSTHVEFGPITLKHPFQIVQLEFTPQGAPDPVVAIDAIDRDSIPNLRNKQVVAIDYDSHNPRIARLHGGTRNFPEQAKFQILTLFGTIAALFIGISIAWQILSSSSRRKTPQTP